MRWGALLPLAAGCAVRVGAGPSVGLGDEAPDVTEVEVGAEMPAWPRDGRGLPDMTETCHFGPSMGVVGRFGGTETRTFALAGGLVTHCHATPWLTGVARTEVAFFELGHERGERAVGGFVPRVALGPRLSLLEFRLGLELTGQFSYHLRTTGEPYPSAGAMFRITGGVTP